MTQMNDANLNVYNNSQYEIEEIILKYKPRDKIPNGISHDTLAMLPIKVSKVVALHQWIQASREDDKESLD